MLLQSSGNGRLDVFESLNFPLVIDRRRAYDVPHQPDGIESRGIGQANCSWSLSALVRRRVAKGEADVNQYSVHAGLARLTPSRGDDLVRPFGLRDGRKGAQFSRRYDYLLPDVDNMYGTARFKVG